MKSEPAQAGAGASQAAPPVEVVMEPADTKPVSTPTGRPRRLRAAAMPLFHRRQAAAAPVIPIVRAPDDPGIDDDGNGEHADNVEIRRHQAAAGAATCRGGTPEAAN